MIRIVLLALVTLVLANHVLAASFDCAKAGTRTEKMICGNLEISRADERLAAAYKQALTKTADKTELKQQQRDWIQSRDVITDSVKLLQAYNKRITALNTNVTPLAGTINPLGRYIYKERGYTGNMVVKQISTFPITWTALISTEEESPSAHMCDFEATATNLISNAIAVDAQFQTKSESDEEPAKFTVRFTSKGAEIDVQSKGLECGMRGYFGGKYVKAGKGK